MVENNFSCNKNSKKYSKKTSKSKNKQIKTDE